MGVRYPAGMTDELHTGELHVERDIVLDRPVAEVWRLVGTAEGWQEWLVDQAAVEVAAGGSGTVVDGDVVRHVDVREIDHGRSLTFRWWEPDDPGAASMVSIHVHELPGGGSRLRIAERQVQPGAPAAMASAGRRPVLSTWSVWEVRACLLALALHSPVRV